MARSGYEAVHIDEVPKLEYEGQPEGTVWRPLRIHFGIRSFGTNAFGSEQPNQTVIIEHSETEESGTRHEELYYVARGHAVFSIGGEEVDAPSGTFVYLPDPDVMRSAVAREPATMVLCFGGTPGEAFDVSPWEREYDEAHAAS